MQRFNWQDVQEADLRQRFPEGADGAEAWRNLVGRARDHADDPEHDWAQEFDRFLGEIGRAPPPPVRQRTCCVFVSHRQADVTDALRVAWLADQTGFDYWLDVHDPFLQWAAGAPIGSPAKEILMAAIIEVALLNVTHVIALHTSNSKGSLWIPYELARAKTRLPVSNQAAGWFKNGTTRALCGEYVYLARQTSQELEITSWLGSGASSCRLSPHAPSWTGPPPAALQCWPAGAAY